MHFGQRMGQNLSFRTLLIGSITLAAGSAAIGFFSDDAFLIMKIDAPLCIAWVVFTGIALKQFRWRGLWLLVGAPLAFLWYAAFAMIANACAHNIRACP
jgi:hypothetical protein